MLWGAYSPTVFIFLSELIWFFLHKGYANSIRGRQWKAIYNVYPGNYFLPIHTNNALFSTSQHPGFKNTPQIDILGIQL